MDDLTAALSGVLSDPDALENLKTLAGSLLGSSEEPKADEPAASDTEKKDGGLFGDLPFSPGDMQKFFKMGSLLKSNNTDDSEAKILMTLRPHLGKKRQKKVDTAVKLLKLIKMLPMLKEMEIF